MLEADVSSFHRFARQLRRAAEIAPKNVERKMVTARARVAADVRARSAWSSRIPGTIRVEGDAVTAGGPGAPGARALNHRGKDGTFRHPVFGHKDREVSQRARPFFQPAVHDGAAGARALANAAIAQTFREVGFH